MNPLVLIVPLLIVMSGVTCFFVLPMSLEIRALILASDLVAAGIVGFVLWRRYK